MTVNDSKSYISFLNRLVDQYNNTCHSSIGKHLLMVIILLWLQKLNRVTEPLNLKLAMESGLLETRIFLAKATLLFGQEKSL